MPQSLDAVLLHLVFSTKERYPFLSEPLRGDIHAYLAQTGRSLGSQFVKVGGVEDHVHIAIHLQRTITIADLVKHLKTESSKVVKKHEAGNPQFAWQRGYGVFSVSPSHQAPLEKYIENQVAHHKGIDFQEEFRGLLRKHGLKWDEAYVWD